MKKKILNIFYQNYFYFIKNKKKKNNMNNELITEAPLSASERIKLLNA